MILIFFLFHSVPVIKVKKASLFVVKMDFFCFVAFLFVNKFSIFSVIEVFFLLLLRNLGYYEKYVVALILCAWVKDGFDDTWIF